MVTAALRNEALSMLAGKGAIIEIAEEVSEILRETRITGAIIGGVAVVLHGHVRTTVDVDVFIAGPLETFAAALRKTGYTWHSEEKEFRKRGVPVHLVVLDDIKVPPRHYVDLERIRTVQLSDLISMKLRSGSEGPLRAQDIAAVIGLIQARRLTAEFARHVDKPFRTTFRKLARMVRKREDE